MPFFFSGQSISWMKREIKKWSSRSCWPSLHFSLHTPILLWMLFWCFVTAFVFLRFFYLHVSNCRDVDLTEKLDYSSAVALLGYSFILSILRSFNVKSEAARVMVAAPLLAFITTHIMFLNFYKLDYGMILLFTYLLSRLCRNRVSILKLSLWLWLDSWYVCCELFKSFFSFLF